MSKRNDISMPSSIIDMILDTPFSKAGIKFDIDSVLSAGSFEMTRDSYIISLIGLVKHLETRIEELENKGD